MKSLFILKPDMLEDEKAMEAFYEGLDEQGVMVLDQYFIHDWVEVSKALYQEDSTLTEEEKREKRKQILTTIKGYNDFYHGKDAILVVVDVKEENLKKLVGFKKKLRKDFVYETTDQRFLKFTDDMDFSQDLSSIDVSNLRVNYKVIPANATLKKQEGYRMCFFNKVHCPDPTVEAVERDFQVLTEAGVMSEENRVRWRR